jgi:uncharacterized protein (TIGR03067 family)
MLSGVMVASDDKQLSQTSFTQSERLHHGRLTMWKFLAGIIGTGILICLLLFVRASDPTKTDRARLEGTWVLVGWEMDGKVRSAKSLDRNPRTWVIRGGRLSILREADGGRTIDKEVYTLRLKPSETPPTMDIVFPDGRANHAIYSLQGDELTVCVSWDLFDNEPKDRPIRFTTVKEQNNGLVGLNLFRFKRDKDGKSSVVGKPGRRRELPPTGKEK